MNNNSSHIITLIYMFGTVLLEIMATLVPQKTELQLPKYSIKKLILHEKNNILTPHIIHHQF
jgi:hypothetical protein